MNLVQKIVTLLPFFFVVFIEGFWHSNFYIIAHSTHDRIHCDGDLNGEFYHVCCINICYTVIAMHKYQNFQNCHITMYCMMY